MPFGTPVHSPFSLAMGESNPALSGRGYASVMGDAVSPLGLSIAINFLIHERP